LFALSFWWGLQFLGITTISDKSPDGSPSRIAADVLKKEFPQRSGVNQAAVLIQMYNGKDFRTSELALDLTLSLGDLAKQFVAAREIVGFWSLIGFTELQQQFVSPDNSSTLINIAYSVENHHEKLHYLHAIASHLKTSASQDEAFVGLTGWDPLFDDTNKASEADFVNMDAIVLPLALFALAVFLRNLRLMIIPIICASFSIMSSFLVMYPFAKYVMPVASFAPSIMVSTVVAMSVDYSLFLLARFRGRCFVVRHGGEESPGSIGQSAR